MDYEICLDCKAIFSSSRAIIKNGKCDKCNTVEEITLDEHIDKVKLSKWLFDKNVESKNCVFNENLYNLSIESGLGYFYDVSEKDEIRYSHLLLIGEI